MKKNKIFPLISINTSDIKKMTAMYSPVISKSPQIPILANLKLHFNLLNSLITFEGTNLKINIVTSIPFKYKIKEELGYDSFEVCIPFVELNKIISICKSDEIKIKFDEKIISINFNSLTYKLPYILDTKEFPITPIVDNENEKLILVNDEKTNFFENLKNISALAGTENMLDISLSSITISGSDGFVSCSVYIGHLMSFFKIESNANFDSILIDKESALIVSKIFKGSNVKLSVGENVLLARSKEITATIILSKMKTRDIISQYFKLKEISTSVLSFDKSEFVDIIKSLSIVEYYSMITGFENDKIHIISKSSTTEQKADKLIDCNGTLDKDLVFNNQNILDLISNISGDTIDLKYSSDPTKAQLVIESNDERDKNKGSILMLMNLVV